MPISAAAMPFAFTLFVWWFSTGAILYLDGLPRSTYRWSVGGASIVLVGALALLHATSDDTSVAGTYLAFTAAILVWGWIEMTFLMGYITGPRKSACPPGSRGWRRASHAFETIAWHELALLAGLAAIALVTHDAPNRLGLTAFLVLWIARASTKLNLFFGVRNLSESVLPSHLRYLCSYFRRRPMNALFPFSIIAGAVAAIMQWQASFASASADESTATSLVATLLTLALLEHVFLVVPFEPNALWSWSLSSRPPEAAAERAPD